MGETSELPFISEDDFSDVITNKNAMLNGDLPLCDQQQNWMKVGRSTKIEITQVASPFKFWFVTKTAMIEVKAMMKSLNSMYTRHLDTEFFRIPSDSLKVGLICAATYHGRWHRAKIVEVVDDREVTVFYVDYGTTSTVPVKHVLYLHNIFSDFPAQAIRGCLDFIRPIDGTWTFESCKFFSDIILSQTIYAKITAIDRENNAFYMRMCKMPKDGKMTSVASIIDAKYAHAVEKPIFGENRIYCELYPTFDMLENGKYPSFQKINKWKKKGFDYYAYDQSIAPHLSCGTIFKHK